MSLVWNSKKKVVHNNSNKSLSNVSKMTKHQQSKRIFAKKIVSLLVWNYYSITWISPHITVSTAWKLLHAIWKFKITNSVNIHQMLFYFEVCGRSQFKVVVNQTHGLCFHWTSNGWNQTIALHWTTFIWKPESFVQYVHSTYLYAT